MGEAVCELERGPHAVYRFTAIRELVELVAGIVGFDALIFTDPSQSYRNGRPRRHHGGFSRLTRMDRKARFGFR